jgi:hypothetical protein
VFVFQDHLLADPAGKLRAVRDDHAVLSGHHVSHSLISSPIICIGAFQHGQLPLSATVSWMCEADAGDQRQELLRHLFA